MKTITEVTLDLAEPNYGAWVGAVQNDANTRTVRAKLQDRGKPWKIPQEADAAVAYRKADGTKGWYDLLADGSPAVTIQGFWATVVLAGQMLTAPGKVRAAIVFHDHALNQLTTFPFTVSVEGNPLSGGEESSDYIRLKWLEEKLDEHLEMAKNSGVFDGKDGESAVLLADSVSYQAGQSGTTPPDGQWQETIPSVPKGCYLWTRRTKQWSNQEPITDYSVAYMGLDGKGAVSSVAGISPDDAGNIPLTPEAVGALPTAGGTMEGPIHMNGQTMDGLNDPTQPDEAVRKAYADALARAAAPVNLLDNSDFTNPVAQAGIGGNHYNQAYAVDRWKLTSGTVSLQEGVGLTLDGTITQKLENPPTGDVSAFVGMASGQADISYSDGAVTITSSGGVIAWAALYEGEYTAGVLPNYHPKGYGNELSECQRHYLRWGAYQKLGLVAAGSSTAGTGYVFMPRMRVNPTISFDNMTVGSDARPITSLTISAMSPNMIEVSVHATGMTAGNLYTLRPASDGYCEFIADKE